MSTKAFLGSINWQNSQSNINRSKAVVKTLAQEFSQSKYGSVVTAIAPVNEPAGYQSSKILSTAKQYYYDSYSLIHTPGPLVEVIHDAFQDLSYWNGFMTSGFENVVMDKHSYNVFSDAENRLDWNGHIQVCYLLRLCRRKLSTGLVVFQAMCARGGSISKYNNANLPVIIGEWTTASTDCAKYLNGRGIGARYDGSKSGSSYIGSCSPKTGNKSGFSSNYKVRAYPFLRRHLNINQCIKYRRSCESTMRHRYPRMSAAQGGSIGRGRSVSWKTVCVPTNF